MTQILKNTLLGNTFSIIMILNAAIPVTANDGRMDGSGGPLAISVRVYNYAGILDGRLTRAQKEAARVLGQAGIEAKWVRCAIPGSEIPSNPICRSQPTPADIVVKLLPRKMARRLMKHHSEFGLAFTAKGEGFGSNLSIFYHRVDELAESRQASRSLLLGHFIAHEIGHLLLGSSSHSRSGLMRVPWNRGQLERASLGTLRFTTKQAARMRVQVSRRLASAPAVAQALRSAAVRP